MRAAKHSKTKASNTHKVQTGSWQPSTRINQLLKAHTQSKAGLGAERAIHYTEFYKKQGASYPDAAIRKAEALAYHLKNRSITIHKDELIIGSHTEHRIGAICHVEFAGFAMLEDLFRFEKRKVNPLYVEPGSRRKLALNVIPYWLTRNITTKAFPIIQGIKYLHEQLNVKQFVVNETGGIAHFLPNYAELITLGTEGLKDRILHQQTKADLSKKQQNQLNANLIALCALEAFAKRYKKLALESNNTEIAELLTRTPFKPAETLQEALQLIWFFQMVIQIETLDQGISLGRIDQYLYPIYQKEKAKSDFDPDKIRNLFCAFCIKLSEVIPLLSERTTEMYSGLPSGQAATIGGLDVNNQDASNELSFLLLDVIENFKTRQPNWHARINKYSSDKFSHRVFEVIAQGGGSPALYNDDVIIPAIEKRFPVSDKVWNYATVGCVEPALPGESFTSSDAAIFNFALILQKVLLQKNIKHIHSMEEVWGALKIELKQQVNYLQYCLDHIETANKTQHPIPFSSLTVRGAIETATDLSDGGANYNASGIQAVGIADLANSLVAIELLVFKQKKVSLRTLANACKNNFKNQAELRARLLGIEKFGNDHAQVDSVANKLIEMFDAEISCRQNTRNGNWMPGFYSMTCHRSMGKRMSALPSGRLKGEALADGLAPTDGSDTLGPTASLNSIANLNHSLFGNGINLNIKFAAETVKGTKGAMLLEGLIKGYFEQGGMQVQVNVLDPKILLEARGDPEKHRNLLVRVSGYSAYFVDLTPAMQDEIINRTLQAI